MNRAALTLAVQASQTPSALRSSQLSDRHEVEADRVADAVVRGGNVAGWSLSATRGGIVQRAPAANAATIVATRTGIATSTAAAPLPARASLPRIEPSPARASATPALQSPGHPLDPETRAFMESRLGFDLTDVRVHTDGHAAESARSMGARAYAVGKDVVFAEGEYAPHSAAGRHLLAHELAHVVQQAGARASDHAAAGRTPPGVQRAVDLGRLAPFVDRVIGLLQGVPGYTLFTMILGKDPLTGKAAPADATSLAGAILELIPGGREAFERLKQNHAIERAVAWIRAEIAQLNFTEAFFDDLMRQVIATLGPGDFFSPKAAYERVKGILRPPFERAKTFAGNVLRMVAEFVMDAALDAIGGRAIKETLHKAGAAISLIASDPIAFMKHLLDAVTTGFNLFSANIADRLKGGLVEWLFGAVKIPGLAIPKTFDLPSIGGMVLTVLGITWARFRASLVDALGEPAVAFIEKSLDVIKALASPGGLKTAWKLIVDSASDLLDLVLAKARDWVVGQVVKIAMPQIAALFVPGAGLIKAIDTIYTTIKFFLDKAKQLAELVKTVVDSISEIANGNVGPAAKWIDEAMTRTIPLVLNFLAGFLHLNGITEAIRGVIEGIRAKVKAAFDKVVAVLVGKGRAAWDATKGAVVGAAAGVAEWWRQRKPFKLGDEDHEIFVEGDGEHPQVMVASDAPTTLRIFLDRHVQATPEQKADLVKDAEQIHWRKKPESADQQPAAADSAVNTAGATAFDRLLDKIRALPGMTGAALAKSQITYGGTHKYGGGLQADAYLTLDHPVGTPPEASEPPIYKQLGSLIDKRSYKKGHLLSMRLGGEGTWRNMMPITNTANQRMYNGKLDGVEKDIIHVVSTGRQAVHFVVNASYADAPDVPATEAEAEARLKTIAWSVKSAQWDGKRWMDGAGDLKNAKDAPIKEEHGVEAAV